MAKIVFAMNQSLDGYVDHDAFAPGPVLFRHWIDVVRGLSGSVYGRGMYELMRYWETDDPTWTADLRDFAAAWRQQPKWVVSRSLTSVGPGVTLVADDAAALVRRLKAGHRGGTQESGIQEDEISVSGPVLAQSLGALGLIDEYRLYVHPVVLGRGRPLFTAARPRLRFVGSDRIDEDVVRLTYVPA